MNFALEKIENLFTEALSDIVSDFDESNLYIEKAKSPEHGHFSTNIAMFLSSRLGKNSRELATLIIEKLDKKDIISKLEIADPGFINIWVEQNFYTENLKSVLENFDDFKQSIKSSDKETVLIDYSSPNIAKPLGVHHILSTIIGDSIKKIYKALNYNVISDNYLGDMGTQFGKLIYAINNWGDLEQIKKDPIEELLKLYVKFHNEAEKNKELDEFARLEFKKFEEGDEKNRDMWKEILEWSMININKIYKRLDINFDYMRGESFYEDKMQDIIKYGREKGIFIKGEGGSLIVIPDNPEDPPAIVQKSDGSSIYLTRDLAQTKYWEDTHHPKLMLWVVDVAQSLHFKQRFQISRKLKLSPAEMKHIDFGRMQFKDLSMSTRKGNIIRLEEILDEAEKRSSDLIKSKSNNTKSNDLVKIMAINSIKYNILHQNRISNITFSWDKIMTFEGNSAPYLMYTIARAKSILRKSSVSKNDIKNYKFDLKDDLEYSILSSFLLYPSILAKSAEEFKANHIANYIYELSKNFNSIYNSLNILNAEKEEKESRLLLISIFIEIMEDAFILLGMKSVDEM